MSNHKDNTCDEILMSEDRTQTYEVTVMLSVKSLIETMPSSRQTHEYLDILNRVKKYLHKHCRHNVVNDLIDIDPDRSMSIFYCTICESTL
jgi:hypothetical protein